jgi:hypothetical protein
MSRQLRSTIASSLGEQSLCQHSPLELLHELAELILRRHRRHLSRLLVGSDRRRVRMQRSRVVLSEQHLRRRHVVWRRLGPSGTRYRLISGTR